MADDDDVTIEWDHSLRCPHCGGLNDLAAEWCMQCAKRLVPARQPIDMEAGAPGLKEVVGGALGVVAGDPHEGSDEGIAEAFSVDGKAVTWTCGRCAHHNPIEASACESCGRSFTDSARLLMDTAVVPKKKARATLKAFGIISLGAVVMRLVAGLISPWAALALLGGVVLRSVVRFFRT